jgi:MSHA biogenesis protein MshO
MVMRGFTLIELIIVIMILGILSGGIFGFLGSGTQMYIDTTERDQILSESRFLVERLNREIRYALPNSIRVAAYINPSDSTDALYHCLELTPIKWSAFYEDIATPPDSGTSKLLAPKMVGSIMTSQEYDRSQADDHYLVVYSTEPDQVYRSMTYDGTGRRVGLSGVSDDTSTSVPADSNPGDGLVDVYFDNNMIFETDSTVKRFYIVSDPISYCIEESSGQITRHTGYGFLPSQNAQVGGSELGSGILMAKNLINELSTDPNQAGNIGDPFRYSDATLERNAIVHLLLRFSRNDEVVVFNNEVHLQNVP